MPASISACMFFAICTSSLCSRYHFGSCMFSPYIQAFRFFFSAFSFSSSFASIGNLDASDLSPRMTVSSQILASRLSPMKCCVYVSAGSRVFGMFNFYLYIPYAFPVDSYGNRFPRLGTGVLWRKYHTLGALSVTLAGHFSWPFFPTHFPRFTLLRRTVHRYNVLIFTLQLLGRVIPTSLIAELFLLSFNYVIFI